ncbi:ABC transporter substrate-binding protein [Stappia indica]|uniref:Extracellular solute-binding protein n=1 Tax=Stappia indica TaxID=538381 RepID=A0A857CDT5_9HYPH|nr:extracellular solute-binding protein [Stappia indica]QGZ36612.1 extracellular solute-binding protein [Stappia indica]
MKGRIFTAAVVAATLAAVTASVPARAADAPTIEELVEGAKKEGRLVVLLLQPTQQHNREIVMEAFKSRFGLDIDIEWSPMHPTTLMSRLNAESPSGRFSADIGQGSVDDLWPSVEKGYVARMDWPATFGSMLESIDQAAGGVPPEMSGTVLSMFDLVYGLVWNTDFVEEADLPRSFADLADESWNQRIALNSYHIAPVDYLSYEIGAEPTIDLVGKLLDNNPVLKAGSGAVGAAVSAGEAAVGTGMAYATDLAIDRGEPVRFRPFTDYTPVLGMKVFVPAYAPNPNAARLFAAWFTTEGMALVGESEHLGQLGNPNSVVGRELSRQIEEAGSKVVSVSSIAQFGELAETRKVIDKMIADR